MSTSTTTHRRPGRPGLSHSGRSPRVTMSLSTSLLALAAVEADVRGISVSELARLALESFLSPLTPRTTPPTL